MGDVAEGKVNATQNIQVSSDGESGKKYIKYKITQDDEYNLSVEAQSDFYVKIYRNGTNDYYFKYPSENNGIYSLEQSAGAYAGNEFVVEINTHNDSPVNVRISMQQQYNWE